MTHLTTTQIMQTVDGTADYATQAAVTSHLAVCSQCRREMEFQKGLLKAVRRAPVPQPSQRLTSEVMSRVAPAARRPFAAWLLNNMGSLFALMAVLGVLWLAFSQPLSYGQPQGETEGERIVRQWEQDLTSGYAKLTESLRALAPAASADRTSAAGGNDGQKLILILSSLAALVVFDRLWSRRLRFRTKD